MEKIAQYATIIALTAGLSLLVFNPPIPVKIIIGIAGFTCGAYVLYSALKKKEDQ